MEPSSTSMIRCVNRRDTRWIATWCRLSASWTPNQPQRPKQTESAASTGEIRSTDASSNAGLIRTGSWGTHLCIRLIYKEYYRNPESSEAFLYPGSIAIAPESALSEMFVFDHALRRHNGNGINRREASASSEAVGLQAHVGQAPITTCEQNEPAFLLQPQIGLLTTPHSLRAIVEG